jgi:hypothetical protein
VHVARNRRLAEPPFLLEISAIPVEYPLDWCGRNHDLGHGNDPEATEMGQQRRDTFLRAPQHVTGVSPCHEELLDTIRGEVSDIEIAGRQPPAEVRQEAELVARGVRPIALPFEFRPEAGHIGHERTDDSYTRWLSHRCLLSELHCERKLGVAERL